MHCSFALSSFAVVLKEHSVSLQPPYSCFVPQGAMMGRRPDSSHMAGPQGARMPCKLPRALNSQLCVFLSLVRSLPSVEAGLAKPETLGRRPRASRSGLPSAAGTATARQFSAAFPSPDAFATPNAFGESNAFATSDAASTCTTSWAAAQIVPWESAAGNRTRLARFSRRYAWRAASGGAAGAYGLARTWDA